jgi:hypothetical protein
MMRRRSRAQDAQRLKRRAGAYHFFCCRRTARPQGRSVARSAGQQLRRLIAERNHPPTLDMLHG